MLPLVSVLLPVHNASATLELSIGSILQQSLRDWELIVVDDGSTDGTAGILANVARSDLRIRIVSPGRVGLVKALNLGLEQTRGEFVARMDADDESHPERLAEQVAWLQGNPPIGLVGCQVSYGGDRAANEGYALHVDWTNELSTHEEIALNRFVESPFPHPSVMFRRELVAKHGGYRDGDFPEDYELWLRWLDAGVKMGKVPRELLTWHDPASRLSRTDGRYSPEAFYRLKAEWVARWLQQSGKADRPIHVCGAGRPTRRRSDFLKDFGIRIETYVDLDLKKTGQKVNGIPVLHPDQLPPLDEILVLSYVGNRGARDNIRADLTSRGGIEGQDFLMCA